MPKTLLGAAIAGLLGLVVSTSGWAQTSRTPGETVEEYTRLGNAYDASIGDLLTDDVVIVIGPCIQAFGPDGCVGKARATEVLNRTFGVHAQITVLEQSESSSTVTQRREVASDVIRAIGVDRIIEDVTFEVQDGLIRRQVAVPDGSDAQTAQFLAAMQMGPPATGSGLRAAEAGSSSKNLAWAAVVLLLSGAAVAMIASRRHRKATSN